MDKDKKETQPQPTDNNSQPATTGAAPNDKPETSQPQDDQDNGDYVVVGSGLGIDE